MFFSKSNRWNIKNKQKRPSVALNWASYKNNLDTSGWKQAFCYRSWSFPAVTYASNFFQMCPHLNILFNHIAAPWSPYFLLKGVSLWHTVMHLVSGKKSQSCGLHMLVMICPKCVSWYHLRCLEQCLGDCDNSIAGWRFWKTVDNYYSLLGKRSPMCTVRKATSVTTITKSLLIINITIKIVINLDKNHHFFSVPAHWSDQVVTNKFMLCHCFPSVCFSLHSDCLGSHAGSCPKWIPGSKISGQERKL